MPKRIYRIEILGDGGKDAAPVDVIAHNAADDLEAYLSAEERVRGLNDPRMVSWRLVMLTEDSSQPVRLNKEQQRIADERRDEVFFAARRAREAAAKAKFDTLKARRLAATRDAVAARGMPALRGSRRSRNKPSVVEDAD